MTRAKWKLTQNADGEPRAEEWGEAGPGSGINLMGSTEIQDRLGLTKGRFDYLSSAEFFPKPAATLNSGRVWLAEDIEAWISAYGQTLAGERQSMIPAQIARQRPERGR